MEDNLVASDERRRDVQWVHTQLRAACIKLEELEEHVVAAYVGHAIALLEERFGIGGDRDDDEADAG